MVHFIENLLSTSADRGLYEALWLVSTTKRNPNVNLEAISIKDLCATLIDQWHQRTRTRENFFISTQLAFGALYVYKFQIDKFYEQAQNALRSCRLELFDINWLSQMSQKHSTPKSSQSQSQSQSQKKKRAIQKKDKNPQSQIQSLSLNEDFDSIEDFFKVLDDDLPAQPVLPKNKKGKAPKNDSGIDPTMVSDSKAITILERNTMMSSGFHTILNLTNDNDEFGDENDFQRLLMETDEVFATQENLMSTSSSWLAKTPLPKRKSMNLDASSKKRRLTYVEFENDIDDLRNASIQHPFANDQFLDEIQDIIVSSFDKCANEPQEMIKTTTRTEQPTMSQLQEDNFEINEPTPFPPPEEVQTNLIIESQLVLEDISNASLPKKRKCNRKLIVDKVIEFDIATMQKNGAKYKATIRKTPFDEYSSRNCLDMRKTSVDLLFNNPCSNLKNGSAVLRKIFERNLKKVPLRVSSKKRKHVEIEDIANDLENKDLTKNNKVKKRRKTLRPRDVLKDLNETNLIVEEMDLEIPTVAIARDFNEIQVPPMDEFILPPAIELGEFNDENTQVSRRRRQSDDEGVKLSIKEILFKLNKLWKKKDQSITMEKLTEGLTSRITVAGVFFELMILSKNGVIELIHKQNSLEIGHIESRM